VRHHTSVLAEGPPGLVVPAIIQRMGESQQVAEDETLALALGAVLRRHPDRLAGVVTALDNEPILRTIALTEAVRDRDRDSPTTPDVLRAWLAGFAGPGGAPALEYVASLRARFPLCALDPVCSLPSSVTEGALRYIFQQPHGRLVDVEVCEPDERLAWAEWLARYRASPLVERSMLLRLPDRLGYDALEGFDRISHPADDRYQEAIVERWCRRLRSMGDETDRARAIDEMIERAPSFGHHGFMAVTRCGADEDARADLWSPALAHLVADVSRDRFLMIAPFLESAGIRAGENARVPLIETVRAYAQAHRRDLGVTLAALLCEHALTPGSIDALVLALETLSEADLGDALVRREAREILVDGLFGALSDLSWRHRLLDELDAALRRLGGTLSPLAQELLVEVRREIERWEPFEFSM